MKLLNILMFSLCFGSLLSAQNNSFCDQLNALQKLTKKIHYTPKTIDDSLSVAVHKLFLNRLDKHTKYFTKDDIKVLQKHELKLDDYINKGECDFIDAYSNVFKHRISMLKAYLTTLKQESLDYSGKDILKFSPDKNAYFNNDTVLQKYWNKRIRYKIISKATEEDSTLVALQKHFKAKESSLKAKVIAREICQLEALENQQNGITNYLQELFLDAFLKYHDPHSTYLNNAQKRLNEASITKTQYSFGVITRKDDTGNIVIAYIIPGSPAFKHGGLEVNDEVLELSAAQTHLETICVSNIEVLQFLNNDTHTTITLKIKKPNNQVQEISLSKAKVSLEQNNITGYVIEGGITSGYVKIPSFYTDLESINGLGLANDLAQEIYKLNQNNVDGLIIDLRFNGGGSMQVATNLCGMFINRGPVAIIKHKNNSIFTLKDNKRGAAFTKPIIILTNPYSASASEFFAGAMQDYNRAIVVGTPTYGKSTAQIVIPLDSAKTAKLGYAKLTVEKFYRPTGTSHQATGVIPDITLPSLYNGLGIGEQHQDYVLVNDTVTPILNVPQTKTLPITALKTKSTSRLKNNIGFSKLKAMTSDLQKNYINKNTSYPLTVNAVFKDLNTYKTLWANYKADVKTLTSNLRFYNTKNTEEILQYNPEDKALNTKLLHSLSQDLQINEAHYILTDLIHLNSQQ